MCAFASNNFNLDLARYIAASSGLYPAEIERRCQQRDPAEGLFGKPVEVTQTAALPSFNFDACMKMGEGVER